MDYAFCIVGKAASTNLKRTLLMLTGKIVNFQRPEQLPESYVRSNIITDKYVKRLDQVPPEYRDWRFKDNRYFTFMFVREPLERLVSAYRFMLVENAYANMDVEIIRKYRPRDYKDSAERYNVTFAEFVRYVLDQYAAGEMFNGHWAPQNELCRVCELRYDFIGHFETLQKDADVVVSKLKSRIMDVEQSRRVANIKFPADSGHQKSSDFLQRMYASVPAAHIKALYQMYADDYTLFGFKHPIITGST